MSSYIKTAFVFVTLGLASSHPASAQSFLTVSQDSNNIVQFNTSTHTSSVFANGLGSLYGVAIGPNGDVYTSEYNSSAGTSDIHRFSSSGDNLGTFGTVNSTSDFYAGLGFDSQGVLYAVDSTGGQIERFSPTGTSAGTFASGITDYPSTIVFNSSGDALVSIGNSGLVREFSSSGVNLGNFATGQNIPEQIALDNVGNVFVNNFGDANLSPHSATLSPHIEKFSASGTDLGNFSFTGAQSTGLAFDGSGNLWSADWGNGNLEEYSSSGTLIGTYASGTNSPRELVFVPGSASAAPEPSQFASIGISALCALGLILKARRKKSVSATP